MDLSIEQKALQHGNILNILMAVIGVILFVFSNSKAVLIDGLFSLIQFIATLIAIKVSRDIQFTNKTTKKKYPLGQYSKETLYVLFKSILIIVLLVFSIFSSISSITAYISDPLSIPEIDLTFILINGGLMTVLCFGLSLVYKHYNKKIGNCSEVLKAEAMGANLDGIISFATAISFILFKIIPFLKPLYPISDAILVLMLTAFFAIQPIQLLISQINILTYKRIHQKSERELTSLIEYSHPELTIYDLFISKLGKFTEIYITLSMDGKFTINELDELREKIKVIVNSKIRNTQIFITFTNPLRNKGV